MSDFTRRLATAKALGSDAAARWGRRLLHGLPPERQLALVRELERTGMPVHLDLEIPSWRTERLVARTHTIEPATTIAIPEHGPLPAEAHGWMPYRARELHGAVLDVDSGLVFSGGRVLAQSGSGTRASRDAAFVSGATARVRKTRPSIHAGTLAPLGDVRHHYHVLLETLPRMLHARRFQPGVTFVTSEDIPHRYAELLDDLGFAILRLNPGSVLIPGALILVDQPDLFWPRQSDLQVLREALGGPDDRPTMRIYAGRGAASRAPRQEAMLGDALRLAGFDAPDLTSLSVREQWTLGRQASHLVGPHGAALALAAALSGSARLTELSSGDLFESCYRRVCALTGTSYRYLALQGSPSAPDGQIDRGTAKSIGTN